MNSRKSLRDADLTFMQELALFEQFSSDKLERLIAIAEVVLLERNYQNEIKKEKD